MTAQFPPNTDAIDRLHEAFDMIIGMVQDSPIETGIVASLAECSLATEPGNFRDLSPAPYFARLWSPRKPTEAYPQTARSCRAGMSSSILLKLF